MTSEPLPARPVGRYGPEPRPGAARRRVVALWVTGLAGLAVALGLGLRAAGAPVTWQDVGFVLEGAERVEVVYDVTRRDSSVPVRCRVHALNERYAEVGVVEVEVPPGDERDVRMSTVVATSELAVTGLVDTCRAP